MRIYRCWAYLQHLVFCILREHLVPKIGQDTPAGEPAWIPMVKKLWPATKLWRPTNTPKVTARRSDTRWSGSNLSPERRTRSGFTSWSWRVETIWRSEQVEVARWIGVKDERTKSLHSLYMNEMGVWTLEPIQLDDKQFWIFIPVSWCQTHGIVGDYKYLPPRNLKLDRRPEISDDWKKSK